MLCSMRKCLRVRCISQYRHQDQEGGWRFITTPANYLNQGFNLFSGCGLFKLSPNSQNTYPHEAFVCRCMPFLVKIRVDVSQTFPFKEQRVQ